ncbi:hypothetical protein [Mycobacterium sp. Aquia_213]|uniref:hypothetical protein n=1 Tax=Mycobacterium sp. Aquia_213 TaxID=2991728 RepID=UPI002270D200|nr:hypothetical protein [Mycobacterium sp. Aquia_213]WAC92225.1 hypothetical protein LMQ14_03180 [Mycobacterium sp. Aquia_213]
MSGGGGDGGSHFSSNPWTSPAREGGDQSDQPASSAGQEACEALQFEARLRNVDADELALVSEGDVLPVVFQEAPSRRVAVVRVQADGSLSETPVGVLLDRLSELLPCLEILSFEAEVIDIDGGNTRVLVRPAA